jgi:hypothetical protein
MSQRDVLAELRTAHVEAPPELHRRVRLIVAQAPAERSRTRRWQRIALVLVPVAAAVTASAVVLATRPAHHGATVVYGQAATKGFAQPTAPSRTLGAPAPAPARGRVQRYGASLDLRVPTVKDVSSTVTQALHVAATLGGFPASVHVSSAGHSGSAELVLRIPRVHVQAAITRLSRLGSIVGEQIDIQDLQAGLNAADRTIALLQRQLKQLRAEPQTSVTKARIAAVTARIVALQRSRTTTVRAAHFATVRLAVATPPVRPGHHRHWRDALPWLGGAAVALLLVLLVLLVRLGRRLREDALLSRP